MHTTTSSWAASVSAFDDGSLAAPPKTSPVQQRPATSASHHSRPVETFKSFKTESPPRPYTSDVRTAFGGGGYGDFRFLQPGPLDARRQSAPDLYNVGVQHQQQHALTAKANVAYPLPQATAMHPQYSASSSFDASYPTSPGSHSPGRTAESSVPSRSSSSTTVPDHFAVERVTSIEDGYPFPQPHFHPRAGSLPYHTGSNAPLGQPFPFDSRKRGLSYDVEEHIAMSEYSLHPSPAISPTTRPSGNVYDPSASPSRPIAASPRPTLSPRALRPVYEEYQQTQDHHLFSVAPSPAFSHPHEHHFAGRAPPPLDRSQQMSLSYSHSSASSRDDLGQSDSKRRRLSVDAEASPRHLSLSHLIGSPRTPGSCSLPISPFVEPDSTPSPHSFDGDLAPKLESDYPEAEDVSVIHRSPPDADFECDEGVKPRLQKIRFEEDHYTPKWVRKTGHAREGFCALCPGEGKWLQMKNSAFWYHRQFQHGVSSVSGHYFLPPVQTRMTDSGDKTEGQCHSCGLWVGYHDHRRSSSTPYKGPTLWFRHSAGCHSYFSPSREKRAARMRPQAPAGQRHA